jgi:hypothetical protein
LIESPKKSADLELSRQICGRFLASATNRIAPAQTAENAHPNLRVYAIRGMLVEEAGDVRDPVLKYMLQPHPEFTIRQVLVGALIVDIANLVEFLCVRKVSIRPVKTTLAWSVSLAARFPFFQGVWHGTTTRADRRAKACVLA